METIRLTEPDLRYAAAIWKFREEILLHDAGKEGQFAGCMSLDRCHTAEEWISICTLRKSKETCAQTGAAVPSHTYLAVAGESDRLIGVIDLRHHIDHPILGTWGGHCGYTVRPCERGKGYAKEMLRMNLFNARAMGISQMLMTCDERNKASENVIVTNGGIYEKTLVVDGNRIKRYWIEV